MTPDPLQVARDEGRVQPRKLDPGIIAVIVAAIAFVIAELVAVFNRTPGDTFSEGAWFIMGPPGGLCSYVVPCVTIGFLGWFCAHAITYGVGWGWQRLVLCVVAGFLFGQFMFLTAPR